MGHNLSVIPVRLYDVFISLLCSPRLHLFDQKYNKKQLYCEILLHFKITVFYLNLLLNVIYSCDVKLYFQHHYSSLQCQKSF